MGARNVIWRGAYFDSVALMRVAAELTAKAGIRAASLVMGTPANKHVLADAGLLTDEAQDASPNDLVIAVDGDEQAVGVALAEAERALNERASQTPEGQKRGSEGVRPRAIARAGSERNLAIVSTPGAYAAAEAYKAMQMGLHVFLFSDNVSLDDEVMLKGEAKRRNLVVMGPDCGTSILNGIPLGFANEVRRGDIGLVGASGTGLQQISTLIDGWGAGTSQVIGVGSRDLSDEVGGVSMLAALDALAQDPTTAVIVLVSKPPSGTVATRILDQAARVGKPVVASFLGASTATPADTVVVVPTIEGAAQEAARLSTGRSEPSIPARAGSREGIAVPEGRRYLRALYSGGTFAYEAALLIGPKLGKIASTMEPSLPGSSPQFPAEHLILDLGDDAFTVGRPHPMIDPTTRLDYLRAAARDPETAVILLDMVIGHGASPDPAGALAPAVAEATARPDGPIVVAFVVGTPADPQGLTAQQQRLVDAGAHLASSSTDAARFAATLLSAAARGDTT